MPAPTIVSVSPGDNQTDVILGTRVVITFDQVIDIDTLSDETFLLMGPGKHSSLSPRELISSVPDLLRTHDHIDGVFTFETVDSKTVATFNPSRPLLPDVTYRVLILGGGAMLLDDAVQNLAGEPLATSYMWSFSTGTLDLAVPPDTSPLPDLAPVLDPRQIMVIPRKTVGNDLSQTIELIFPANIDPDSVDLNEVLVSVEAMLNDPKIGVPEELEVAVEIVDNKLLVTIVGWEA